MPQVLSGHHTLLLCPPRLSLPPFCPQARQAFVSKQVLLIEAWRPVHLEEAEVADHHGLHGRRIAEQLLEGGEQVEVAAALARLEEEAEGRFRLQRAWIRGLGRVAGRL